MKDALITKIKSTKNGYIFTPTGRDIKVAKEHPDTFVVGNMFPYRISLK